MYTKSEKEIFSKVREKNKNDLRLWNLSNLGFPLLTFGMTIFIFCYTDKASKIENYYSVIFSGVLPLIAINILVAASFFLIKFNKEKEIKYQLDTSNTRLKLIIYAFGSYLFASSIFVIQNIFSPFAGPLARFIQLTCSVLAIYFSLNISNKLFLLQEDMIEKSYDKVMYENVTVLKEAIE